ncbi:MAG: hypothetical protein Q9M48_09085 [Rhodobacterales bacterium]|nr:hypothetical protein [Rhodobacterales bacterium]
MLEYTHIEKYNIHYIRVSEPFSLQELYLLLANPSQKHSPATDDGPAILDMRHVKVERLEMHDIRRHLIKKGDLGSARTDFTCAYLVATPEAASKVRVANIFSELTGVAPENKTFVTTDFTDAAAWIAKIVKENKYSIYQELEALALIEARPPPYRSF